MDNITISPQRMLGDISIDCTIREQHADPYTLTGHPVEQGAQVSDHMYREQAQLVFEIGFTNSSEQAGGDESYVVNKYQEILKLQATREPMTITTGKRTYQNMVILNPAVTTDEKTEAVLMVTVTCREVIIVQTTTTSVPPADVQADPAKTSAVQDRGTIQPRPAALSPAGG